MTTACLLRRLTPSWTLAAGEILLALLAFTASSRPLLAQNPKPHWLHAGMMPPGAIGSQRLLRGGPLSGCFQTIVIQSPEEVSVSIYDQGGFTAATQGDLLAGVLIGQVYRFKVVGVPNHPETVIYPTVELIDRLYPPPGKELKFPVPVQLTSEELQMAARGAFITRVIYLEDPNQAIPVEQKSDREHSWFEARPGDDPLVVADTLGRPMAILRIGARFPNAVSRDDFHYGGPPVQLYDQPSHDLSGQEDWTGSIPILNY